MAEKTLQELRNSIIEQYRKDYPGEKINGKVFSMYLLERYARLMYKIYQKAKK